MPHHSSRRSITAVETLLRVKASFVVGARIVARDQCDYIYLLFTSRALKESKIIVVAVMFARIFTHSLGRQSVGQRKG